MNGVDRRPLHLLSLIVVVRRETFLMLRGLSLVGGGFTSAITAARRLFLLFIRFLARRIIFRQALGSHVSHLDR